MGLDITAYRKMSKIDAVFDVDGEPIDPATRLPLECEYCRPYINPEFPGRSDDIESKSVYSFEDSMGFRAGSYGGYNAWREELAKMAGYKAVPVDRYNTGNIQMRHDYSAFEATEGPFWETINFSDAEGVIGSTVSAKLAKDFADWDERAKKHGESIDQPNWFYEKYQEWRTAYEMAADGGAVQFH
jgi:hypothetical protein